MLPRDRRLRRPSEYSHVMRGRRSGRRHLVAHLAMGPNAPARVGFVVSKAVGGSVVRSTVARRLRHLVADRLHLLPDGTLLVVRALPPAATADSRRLGADLDGALARLLPAGRP